MTRGSVKNVLVLKSIKPYVFDEVIFFINDGARIREKNDLVYEANKVISEYEKRLRFENGQNTIVGVDNNKGNANSRINKILNVSLILAVILMFVLFINL